MSFLDLAEKRCSIRGFKPDPIPKELLDQILRAGQLAPTAKNLQPFHFIVVQKRAVLDELAKAYPAPFFAEAPLVIAVCVEPEKGWTRIHTDGKNYCEVDAAIATDHMALAVEDLGLGACWVVAFDPAMVRETLQLPQNIQPLALLPIGFPNAAPRVKQRKPLEDLVRYDHW
jgi:nitroreductase